MMRLYGYAREMILKKWVAIPVILIGVAGGVIGFIYWYGPTFARYEVWQWPFVPDCPLFALMFTLSLTLILIKRRIPLYDALVAFGLIKYGSWTVTYWIAYWINSGGNVTVEGLVMALTHLGMILEGLFLLSFLDMNWPTILVCTAWFGLSDWMDYGPFLTYPRIDIYTVPLALMQWQTVGVTVLMTMVYIYLAWQKKHT